MGHGFPVAGNQSQATRLTTARPQGNQACHASAGNSLSRLVSRYSARQTKKMIVTMMAETTHHWQIASMTNSSSQVSQRENRSPDAATRRRTSEAVSESAKRS